MEAIFTEEVKAKAIQGLLKEIAQKYDYAVVITLTERERHRSPEGELPELGGDVVGGKAVKKGGAESFPFAHLARSGTPPGHPNKYQYRVGMDQVDRHHSFLAALGSISPSSSASHGSTASCSTSPRMIKSEDVGTGPIRTTKTTPQGILKPYTRPNGPWTPEPTQ